MFGKLFWFIATGGLLFGGLSAQATVAFSGNGSFTFTATSGLAFSVDANSLLANPGSGNLSWGAPNGKPTWLTISPTTGLMTGTPANSDASFQTFILSVQDNSTGTGPNQGAIATININVLAIPIWSQNPIDLGIQNEGAPLTVNLNNYVSAQGSTLTFSYTGTLPSWLTLSPGGMLTGTPPMNAIGDYGGFSFVATTASGGSASAAGKGTVVSQAPVIQNPIALPHATVGTAYSQSIATYASEANVGDTLTFTKISGPGWATITPAGNIVGTPTNTDAGPATFTMQVTNTAGQSATTTVQITVVKPILAPVWLQNPLTLATATANTPYTFDISVFATDPNGLPLTFTKVSGPAWLNLSAAGQLSGTPANSDIGSFTAVFQASNGTLFTAVNANGTVVRQNVPPVWSTNPIVLPNATATIAYSQGLSQFVTDPNPGATLSFSKVSGPPWANVAASGTISGVPQLSDLGPNSFVVNVSDSFGQSANVNVTIIVVKLITPPAWTKNPIPLGNTTATQPLTFDLTPFVANPDQSPLNYSVSNGPAWLFVSPQGQISGTPPATAVGPYTATFNVTDGTTSVSTEGFGTVLSNILPPVINEAALTFTVKERSTFTTNLAAPGLVTDPQGDVLTFAISGIPSWTSLTGAGVLTLTPLFKDIGTYSFNFSVTDTHNLTSTGTLTITVIRDPRPPVWSVTPIQMTTKVNQSIVGTLAGQAQDLDNLPLTFSLVSGPAWLKVAPDGTLSGTPTTAEVDTFVVSVANDKVSAPDSLIITVIAPVPHVDTVTVDASATATVENLWVDENLHKFLGRDDLTKSLEANIHCYYDELASAKVSASAVYLTSAATIADAPTGTPVPSRDGSLLLSSNENDVEDDFAYRTETYSLQSCNNSPIWSMNEFYPQIATTPALTNGYFAPNIPMEVLIITKDSDQYQAFSKGSRDQNKTPDDYATAFIALHQKANKPFHISAIAAQCPDNPASPVPYQTLVNRTNGKFYPYVCDIDMCATLKDYADNVIFRAKVYTNQTVKLSALPQSGSITVTLAGTPLAGNTGAATDAWTYDATNNQVLMKWSNIDTTKLKSGDTIQVSYTSGPVASFARGVNNRR